jgi:RHS repeat-associated protein
VTDTSYTADALNRYTAISGTLAESTLAHDADGNLTQDGTWTYTYDGENRLQSMSKSGQTLTFTYDYAGRRIRKLVTGTGAKEVKYLWSGWKLAAELAADGSTVTRTFVWGPDFSDGRGQAGGAGSLLAQIDSSGGIAYAVPDALGNIVGYADGNGAIVAAREFTPFGRVIAATSSSPDYPIGYSGQYTDAETGLVYYGLRYYSPRLGRFVNRDPIEEAGGNNLFAFVRNSPTNGWDVRGLAGQACVTIWVLIDDGGGKYHFQPERHCEPTGGDDWHGPQDPTNGNGSYTNNNNNNNPGGHTGGTGGHAGNSGGSTGTNSNGDNDPNNKQLSKSECDSLASKIGNNVATLDRIASTQGENLNGGAVNSLRSMWDAVGYPAELTGYAEGIYENGYRMAKTLLDASGNSSWRKSITGAYKSAAPTVKVVGGVLTAMDVVQLGVDINDRDGLMFISHSAEMGLGLMQLTPGMNLVVMGSRYAIRDQLGKLQGDVDRMDATGAAAYNQEMSRNVVTGTRNVNQWQKEWNDGGCARFNK